ncbi:MAG: ATP-binding cassette domain-containing protein [Treponemataceae bacterium]|nr:ATP-binding cassette domain-containing protein [Treponemataceae bacterium]
MIEFNNVSFEYTDGTKILSDLNLKINRGEVILLCGESGCGKSTLIRMINGLIPNYYPGKLSGSVLVNGVDTQKAQLYELSEHVASVFQNPKTQFYNVDSTEEMVFSLENKGIPREEMKKKLADTVKRLRMDNLLGRNLFRMSGGEKQKVACACADTSDAPIIVLDEPSSNLDLHSIRELAEIIKQWKADGKTVIVAEHRLYYMLPYADRVLYLKQGKIEMECSAAEIIALGKDKLSAMGLRSTDIFGLPLNEPSITSKDKIELTNFRYIYPGSLQPSLDVMDVKISRNAIIGVVGDNGAGKSTFARALCGFEKHATGGLTFDGTTFARRKRLRKTFMVMQDVGHQLFTDEVQEELSSCIDEPESDEVKQEKVYSLLKKLNLDDKAARHPHSLSGGEKQRVAIGSAVISDREIIVFDEPTSGLDYRHMKTVAALIRELKAKGKTIFLITHDPELIAECCDELIYMQNGKVLEYGKLTQAMYNRWLYRTSTHKEKKNVEREQLNPIKRLWQLAKKQHKRLIASIILALIGVLGSVVPFVCAGQVINALIGGNRDLNFYLRLCLIGLGGIGVKTIFYSSGLAVSHKAAFSIIADIRKAMFNKLPKMPLGTILDTSSGKLKQIIVDEVDSMERPIAHMIPELSANVVGAVAIWILLMTVDWRMGFLTLVSIPIGLGLGALVLIGYSRDYETAIHTVQEMNATIVEYIHGIEVIKAYNQGKSSYTKFKDRVMATANYYYQWMKRYQSRLSLAYSIAPCTLITVLPIGFVMYQNGTLDLGTFITSIMLSMCIVGPVISALNFADTSGKLTPTITTVDEILNGNEQLHSEKPVELKSHDIQFKDVSYSYHKGTQVLHNINLDIKEKSMTALVGPSGSGKSTIAKLVAGFWDVQDGELTMGGFNLKDIPLKQLYDQIAFVSQDTYLFNDTVMNNIRMGRMSATDDEVVAAAKASGSLELIENLADGFDTMVGQGGAALSGGERQRIAIARAMIKDAPVVILDEATAYIDPENEAILQHAIGQLIKDKTVIVIAHRLSTITDADKIVLVNDGTVQAAGTHQELLKKDELYRSMWDAHMGVEEGGAA